MTLLVHCLSFSWKLSQKYGLARNPNSLSFFDLRSINSMSIASRGRRNNFDATGGRNFWNFKICSGCFLGTRHAHGIPDVACWTCILFLTKENFDKITSKKIWSPGETSPTKNDRLVLIINLAKHHGMMEINISELWLINYLTWDSSSQVFNLHAKEPNNFRVFF